MTAFAADSHPGHKRSHNEDCFLADGKLGLFLVADGVGGHSDGEVAAAIVRDTLRQEAGGGVGLVEAIEHAHAAVLEEIGRRQDSNMGSTVVVALVSAGEYDIAWVGDSRAYSYDGVLRQLSRDHNPVSEMLARGALTPEQAAVHPQRNVLSQSLGVSAGIEVNPGRVHGAWRPGQQLILCSDGLTDEVSDHRIAQIMGEQATPEAQVGALIRAALDGGGRDNITVVIVGAGEDPGCASGPGGVQVRLENRPGVTMEPHEPGTPSHKRKVLWLLGLTAALAAAWVALEAF